MDTKPLTAESDENTNSKQVSWLAALESSIQDTIVNLHKMDYCNLTSDYVCQILTPVLCMCHSKSHKRLNPTMTHVSAERHKCIKTRFSDSLFMSKSSISASYPTHQARPQHHRQPHPAPLLLSMPQMLLQHCFQSLQLSYRSFLSSSPRLQRPS